MKIQTRVNQEQTTNSVIILRRSRVCKVTYLKELSIIIKLNSKSIYSIPYNHMHQLDDCMELRANSMSNYKNKNKKLTVYLQSQRL